jgi:uncharacterized membrane protein YebE (DUF533 family)
MKTNTLVTIASLLVIGYVGYMVYDKMKKDKEQKAQEEAKMDVAKKVASVITNPTIKLL